METSLKRVDTLEDVIMKRLDEISTSKQAEALSILSSSIRRPELLRLRLDPRARLFPATLQLGAFASEGGGMEFRIRELEPDL